MKPLTGTSLFALFEDAMVGDNEEASQTWLAGYVLGLTDALCHKRKYYPRGWW